MVSRSAGFVEIPERWRMLRPRMASCDVRLYCIVGICSNLCAFVLEMCLSIIRQDLLLPGKVDEVTENNDKCIY